MKNNNYKPRIVEFKNQYVYNVDTRMGMYGFYPGDVVSNGAAIVGLVLGVEQRGGSGDALIVASKDWCMGEVSAMFEPLAKMCKLIKRHAQRLIDNGEMIQVG